MKKSASGAGTAAICNHFRLEEGTVIWGKGKVCRQSGCVSLFHFFGSSRKVGETNKGLGKAPKCRTRKKHESATNPIAKRGQGAIAPCRVKGQRPLWGLGQRPNCSASNLLKGRSQEGAGSEASLPVTLRVRRRALKLLFPQDSVKNHFFAAIGKKVAASFVICTVRCSECSRMLHGKFVKRHSYSRQFVV